jgi:PilZ domain
MQAGPSLARPTRARHRHELRTLTYVTLDQANGGIVRNLTHDGIAVQAVAAVRPRQHLRVRFELRYPRLRVETRGEVVWSTFSGQCGIRFVDASPSLVRQIDEWIFGDLLQGLAIPTDPGGFLMVQSAAAGLAPAGFPPASPPASPITARVLEEFEKEGEKRKQGIEEPGSATGNGVDSGETESEEDGLVVSPAKMKVIELRPSSEPQFAKVTSSTLSTSTLSASVFSAPAISTSMISTSAISVPKTAMGRQTSASANPRSARVELDWLSQPLSGRGLAWTVDVLVVTAATLLFALVFLSITGEAPKWPYAVSAGGLIAIGGLYWGFFRLFAGSSLGERLARLSEMESSVNEDAGARFR